MQDKSLIALHFYLSLGVNEMRFVENDATSRVSRWSYHTAHIPLQVMGERSC